MGNKPLVNGEITPRKRHEERQGKRRSSPEEPSEEIPKNRVPQGFGPTNPKGFSKVKSCRRPSSSQGPLSHHPELNPTPNLVSRNPLTAPQCLQKQTGPLWPSLLQLTQRACRLLIDRETQHLWQSSTTRAVRFAARISRDGH